MKYYIKDNIVFSSLTTKIKVIDKINEIEIPSTTKSHLINNKILITDLDKIINNIGRNFEITKPIENFEEVKQKIKQNKSKLKKVTTNDYDFIEKTASIEIVQSILTLVENSNLLEIEGKINNYIKNTKEKETQKNTEIEELIEVENNKIKELNDNKDEILKENSVKELEKLEIEKKNINKEIEKQEIIISKNSSNKDNEFDIIRKKQENINHQIQDFKFEIKLIKNRIKTLKAKLKLGKNKQFNWITAILLVFTLGLIYWSRFTDTKYYILKLEEKEAQIEEKITQLERDKFNLEKEIKTQNEKFELISKQNYEKEEIERKKIDNLNIKLEKINKKILELENEIKKEDSKIESLDKEIYKSETKILDLESTKKEFEKYSTLKIKEKLEKLSSLKEEKIKELKEIKDRIKSQKIEFNGEFIIEL